MRTAGNDAEPRFCVRFKVIRVDIQLKCITVNFGLMQFDIRLMRAAVSDLEARFCVRLISG